MDPFSRRIFLKVSGAAALTPAAVGAATATGPAARASGAAAPHGGNAPTRPYLYLSAAEASFIEPAVDRLIPPDALGPSAREAGVPAYIDRQLAGAWGAGERLYRAGPWQQGSASQGYQLPFTPAELFRNALRGVGLELQREGKSFDKLDGPAQDAYLTHLQNGTHELEGVPAKTFFESLLSMTIEGYFSDPAYGGNEGMAAWAMIGFPGAYGNYYELVDRHGIAFNVPPRSLAEDGRCHVTEMQTNAMGAAAAPRKGVR
jgi:gluconate 2-dehydrogenase gamma chain